MKRYALLFLMAASGSIFAGPAQCADTAAADRLLLEAENFDDCGGWVVDQQFMDQMGSPYLLAHGLGDPVRDAVTVARFPSAGMYRVWVRTRDWVAPWKAPGRRAAFRCLSTASRWRRPLEPRGPPGTGRMAAGSTFQRGPRSRCMTLPVSRAAAMLCCSARIPTTNRPTICKRSQNSAANCSVCRSSPNAAGGTIWSSWAAALPALPPPWPGRGWA